MHVAILFPIYFILLSTNFHWWSETGDQSGVSIYPEFANIQYYLPIILYIWMQPVKLLEMILQMQPEQL